MNVAVDAMGGDKSPEVVIQGAVGVADAPGIHVTLFVMVLSGTWL